MPSFPFIYEKTDSKDINKLSKIPKPVNNFEFRPKSKMSHRVYCYTMYCMWVRNSQQSHKWINHYCS